MQDLELERKAVADVIVHSENVPIMAEYITDVQNTPRKVIEDKVKGCDAYIGIFHKRWGFVPISDNPELLSVTAIEYEVARTIGLPRLILISNETKETQLNEFIEKITNFDTGQWQSEYNNITDLVKSVALSIPALTEKALHRTGYPGQLEIAIVTDTRDLSLKYDEGNLRWHIMSQTEQVELVTDNGYSNVIDIISKSLSERKTVILTGPHGTGKSILASYFMAQKIMSGVPVVAVERLDLQNVRDVLDIAAKEKLPVLYDPMGPAVYEDRNEVQGLAFQNLEKIDGMVKEIMQSNAVALIVLPSDLLDKVQAHFSTSNYVSVNLENYTKHESFLKNIIKVYAHACDFSRDQVLNEFADKLKAFDDGYTLIAAYIGRWLRKNDCNVKNVEQALTQAQGKPIRFLQYYLWVAVLNKDIRLSCDFSLPLLVYSVMGPISAKLAEEIPLHMNFRSLPHDLAEWISRHHEHLMEIAIKDLVISASKIITDPPYMTNAPYLGELYDPIKEVINRINNLEELHRYPYIDYKVIGYVQRWLALRINENKDQLGNLLDMCSRNILLSYQELNVSNNVTTRYLMIGNEIPKSSSLILKGYPGKIEDILELIAHQEIDYCNRLSFPLNKIKVTGSLNEETYIDMLTWILGVGIQQDIEVECLIDSLYGIFMTSNSYPYLASNVYWQTGMRLIEKAIKLFRQNNQVAIILSYYLKLLVENKIGGVEVLQKIFFIGQTDYWVINIVISIALIHFAIVTHNKKLFSEIVKKINNYIVSMPSTGLILIAEIGHKLFEACETFGEPEGLEFWYSKTEKSIKELEKWGERNPDVIEYLEFYHHFGHYENTRWFDAIQLRFLEMKGRILLRNNQLRYAERNSERILRIKREKHLGDEDDLLSTEFKLLRLKILRLDFTYVEELGRIWRRALAFIRFMGRLAFLEIMSTYVVFSDTDDAKKVLAQFGYLLTENNSIALITYGLFLIQKGEQLHIFWDSFMKFLKLYSDERRKSIGDPNGNFIFDTSLSHLHIYPEIQPIASSLLNNSSGLVGLIIYAYIKKDQKLIQQLLSHGIEKFGYIKIMNSICKRLLGIAQHENGINSPEFHENLLRLYFMRIT
jgi:hypothetical protein